MNKWVAQIRLDGVCYNLGYFTNIEEAREARAKKANELFGEFTNKCEKIREHIKEIEKTLEELEQEFLRAIN